MATCSEMEIGEIYVCEECGLEIQVIKSCASHGTCGPTQCNLRCCDEELKLREKAPVWTEQEAHVEWLGDDIPGKPEEIG